MYLAVILLYLQYEVQRVKKIALSSDAVRLDLLSEPVFARVVEDGVHVAHELRLELLWRDGEGLSVLEELRRDVGREKHCTERQSQQGCSERRPLLRVVNLLVSSAQIMKLWPRLWNSLKCYRPLRAPNAFGQAAKLLVGHTSTGIPLVATSSSYSILCINNQNKSGCAMRIFERELTSWQQ